MAPVLPRVPAFPIVGERNALTVIGSGLTIPASVHQDCPLIGKEAPEILLPDHLGRRCSLHATIALGRPIILFFFPLAGSPHCTMESCMFRDALGLTPVFAELQAIVIGISQDPPARSKRFVDEHHLGYQILHDENRVAMDTYGVPRTWMGLLDQRCTFVIDPSGLVRSMVQGVFDARGHVRFAEQWLVRFEHELSQRSRRAVPVEQYGPHRPMVDQRYRRDDDDDDEEEIDESQIGIAYGGANTAIIGGIDAAPRHGAASMATSSSMARSVSHGGLRRAPITFNRQDENGSASADVHAGEKNVWKNWKVLLQQLSSADDKPPPLVMMRTKSRTGSEEVKSSSFSTPMKKSGSASRLLPRTRSSPRLKDLDKQARRSSTSHKSVEPSNELAAAAQTNGTTNGEIPPVPPLFAVFDGAEGGSVDSNGIVQVVNGTRKGKRNDSNSSEQDASLWGTDSLSSHISTAATSMFAGSRQGHSVQLAQATKPAAITSEVLMPGDVYDLDKGSLPMVVRQVPNVDEIPVAPTPPPKSITSRNDSAVPAIPQHTNVSSQPSHPIRAAPPAPHQLSEELNEDDDAGRYRTSKQPINAHRLRSPDDGKMQSNTILRSPSQQSGNESGRSTPRGYVGGRTSGEFGARASPSLSNLSDNVADSGSRIKTPTYQSWRSPRHQASPSVDGVYRISTPSLADAAEPISRVDVEPSLSPRPRSIRLESQTRSSDSRLRRPINPPKDAVIAGLSRQTRQVSLGGGGGGDSPRSSEGHSRFQAMTTASALASEDAASPASNNLPLDEDEAQIQRVVRRTSLRPDKPTMVDSAQLNVTPPRIHGRNDVHASPASQASGNPLTMSIHAGQPLRDGLDRIIVDPAVLQEHTNEDRRPSASSIGTFGRRDSMGSDDDLQDHHHHRDDDDDVDDDNVSVY